MCRNMSWKTLSEVINGGDEKEPRQEGQDLAQVVHINSAEVGAGHPSRAQFNYGGRIPLPYLSQSLCIRQARPFLSGPSECPYSSFSVEGERHRFFRSLSHTHTPPMENESVGKCALCWLWDDNWREAASVAELEGSRLTSEPPRPHFPTTICPSSQRALQCKRLGNRFPGPNLGQNLCSNPEAGDSPDF